MTDERIKQIANTNGMEVIYNKSFEEIGELNTALARYQAEEKTHYKGIVEDLLVHSEVRDELISELADVQIMCKQIAYACNMEKEVKDMVEQKIERQLKRMEKYTIADAIENIDHDNYLGWGISKK